MTKALAPALRGQIVRLLLLRWPPDDIAEVVHCGKSTIYLMQQNLFVCGTPYQPHLRPKGRPRKISTAAGDSLISFLRQRPWAIQKEMVWFL